MAGISIIGSSGSVQDVGPNGAAKTQLKHNDYGAGGVYRVAHRSGVMAAGLVANSEVFQFRWVDATKKALITRICIEGGANAGTAFAAGVGILEVLTARSWSADGSGGTAIVMTANNGKLDTRMATSALNVSGAIRGSSTTALTAGTKTLDAQPLSAAVAGVSVTAGAQLWSEQFLINHEPGQYPLLLSANEGFIVRATVPATGTWTFALSVVWSEVTDV